MNGLTKSQIKKNLSQSKWDMRYLDRAATLSLWSKDPSTQVGAVITDGNRPISEGFNGMQQKIVSTKESRYLINRDIKLQHIIHGEMNAIIFAKQDLTGATLYTWPFLPCTVCASIVIQAGITTIVSTTYQREWCSASRDIFTECGVDLRLYKVRDICDYEGQFGLSFQGYQDFLRK